MSESHSPIAEAGNDEFALEAYRQNFETFRSLNALMWQIPLIAMTLTGGLWFGVSKVEALPMFRGGLLALAGLGNLGLAIILHRLRYVMGCYLEWLKNAHPAGHVAAPGNGFFSKSRRVQQVFSLLLVLVSTFSFVLLVWA